MEFVGFTKLTHVNKQTSPDDRLNERLAVCPGKVFCVTLGRNSLQIAQGILERHTSPGARVQHALYLHLKAGSGQDKARSCHV